MKCFEEENNYSLYSLRYKWTYGYSTSSSSDPLVSPTDNKTLKEYLSEFTSTLNKFKIVFKNEGAVEYRHILQKENL